MSHLTHSHEPLHPTSTGRTTLTIRLTVRPEVPRILLYGHKAVKDAGESWDRCSKVNQRRLQLEN